MRHFIYPAELKLAILFEFVKSALLFSWPEWCQTKNVTFNVNSPLKLKFIFRQIPLIFGEIKVPFGSDNTSVSVPTYANDCQR